MIFRRWTDLNQALSSMIGPREAMLLSMDRLASEKLLLRLSILPLPYTPPASER